MQKKIIDFLKTLTDDDRVNAFIVDDSLFERTSCKHTQLGAKVFDHCDMRYKKGYRLMALTWTDGNTMIPVNSSLLSSADPDKIIGTNEKYDLRSLAGQRRKLACMKGINVMIELIQKALHFGIDARMRPQQEQQ